MKKITHDQFLSLIEVADRIEFDNVTVEHFVVAMGEVILGMDCGLCEYEFRISDDKEFFFDSENGRVNFKDSDGENCVVNFYVESPLTEIPE